MSGGTVNATGGNSNSSYSTNRGGSGIYTIIGETLTFTGGTINITGCNGSNGAKGGYGISEENAKPDYNIVLGNATNPFNGILTAIGGTGSTNGTAFNKDEQNLVLLTKICVVKANKLIYKISAIHIIYKANKSFFQPVFLLLCNRSKTAPFARIK